MKRDSRADQGAGDAPSQPFAALESLMGGWFHQDFDLEGDTLEEIVGKYRQVTPRPEQLEVIADIQRFLVNAKDVDKEFEESFRPDVLPTGFAPSTRAFLERIAELLDARQG